jgi:hypothetical protein
MKKTFLTILSIGIIFGCAVTSSARSDDQESILKQLPNSALQVVSTVPGDGDQNPYGVAFVPRNFPEDGTIHAGDILVSNFNNSNNIQGTGTTIVSITPGGTQNLFFQGAPDLGLTTALGVLRRGVILVGNLPTTNNGMNIGQGSLIAIDRWGHQIASFTDPVLLDGPWDLSLIDLGSQAIVFVSSVLNGTVSRLRFDIAEDGKHIAADSGTLIAKGYQFRTDPNALVVGPTGLALDPDQAQLFVASTADNAIYSIPNAVERDDAVVKGELVYLDDSHLRGPLGLLLAPNGNLITANGDAINADAAFPSELVEFTKDGRFVAQFSVDPGEGGAFGIALHRNDDELRFAAVDDVTNSLKIWTLKE